MGWKLDFCAMKRSNLKSNIFLFGKIPLLHHLSKSVVRFWGSKLPEQHPWRFTETQNYFILFFSPETNIPGIRFSGLIWRLSGVRVVFRYYQLNSSIHYIIYIILCHWTWPQISKYLLKEMWTHTNIMSLVALYLALLPSVHCTCAPRELFTPRDWAGSSIVADGVWVPGIGVPGVLRIQHLAKIFVGIHKCTKNHVQLVMSIGNIYIYIYTYISTPMAWSNVEHDREETRFRFSIFPHPALGYLWILVDNCTRKSELVSSTSLEFFV